MPHSLKVLISIWFRKSSFNWFGDINFPCWWRKTPERRICWIYWRRRCRRAQWMSLTLKIILGSCKLRFDRRLWRLLRRSLYIVFYGYRSLHCRCWNDWLGLFPILSSNRLSYKSLYSISTSTSHSTISTTTSGLQSTMSIWFRSFRAITENDFSLFSRLGLQHCSTTTLLEDYSDC